MMKTLLVILSLILVNQCNAQQKKSFEKTSKTTSKTNKMKRPNINNKFETLNLDDYKDGMKIEKKWSLGSKSYYDNYSYRKVTGNEIIEISGNKDYTIDYRKTFTNDSYIIYKEYYGKSGYIKRKGTLSQTTQIALGEEYQFDENGTLIKSIDHDKGWDFSYEDVIKYLYTKYKIKPEQNYTNVKIKTGERTTNRDEDTKVITPIFEQYEVFFDIKKSKSYNGLDYWNLRVKTGFITKKYRSWDKVKLDAKTGKVLCDIQYEDDWGKYSPTVGESSIEEKVIKIIVPDATIPPSERPTAQIYKSYRGKDYTESEWKIFEQEHYNEHLRKTGRADLIKPTETPKIDNKNNSFIADEDDVKPKKKGFWG